MTQSTTTQDLMGLGVAPPLAVYLVSTAHTAGFSDLEGLTATASISGLDAAQGGVVEIVGGTSSTSGNAGGAVTITGGTPGATGAGGAITISGGDGGATSGTGGAVTITTGDGTASNASAGTLTITPGNGNGTAAGSSLLLDGGGSGTGATGNGGTARLRGGQALSDGGVGGTVTVQGGQGGVTTGSGGATNVTGGQGAPTGRGGHVTITGGSAGATSGNGGDIIFVSGTATGSGVAGATYIRTALMFRQRTPYALTASATMVASSMTAADMLITGNAGTGAGVNYTLPTATNLDSALSSSLGADDAIMMYVINLSAVAAEDITIVTNTGWTLVGNMVVQENTSAAFIVRFTAANTATLYRV